MQRAHPALVLVYRRNRPTGTELQGIWSGMEFLRESCRNRVGKISVERNFKVLILSIGTIHTQLEQNNSYWYSYFYEMASTMQGCCFHSTIMKYEYCSRSVLVLVRVSSCTQMHQRVRYSTVLILVRHGIRAEPGTAGRAVVRYCRVGPRGGTTIQYSYSTVL